MKAAERIGRTIDLFYRWPFDRILSRELFRYAACGGGNMLSDAVLYFLIYHYIIAERYLDLGFVVVSPPYRLAGRRLSVHLPDRILAQPQHRLSGLPAENPDPIAALSALGSRSHRAQLSVHEVYS